MPHVFGVANHSPCQIRSALVKSGIVEKASAMSILMPGASLAQTTKHKVVLVLCIQDLMRNLRFVNSDQYKGHKFLVFGSPVLLGDLHGVHPLDYKPEPDARTHGYALLPLKRAALGSIAKASYDPVRKVKGSFMSKLIGTVIKGSLLGPLMTYIYTLPSSTHQTPVKHIIAQWLYSGKDLHDLGRMLDSLRHIQITPKIKARFAELLSTEAACCFQQVFAAYKKNPKTSNGQDALPQICKQHGVDAYEVRYLLSVLSKDSSEAPMTDLRTLASRLTRRPASKSNTT